MEELLLFRLDQKLDRIAPDGPLGFVVLDVIKTAEREGWTADLLRAIAAERPSRKDLQSLVDELLMALEGGKTPPESPISSVPSTPRSNLGSDDKSGGRAARITLRDRLANMYSHVADNRRVWVPIVAILMLVGLSLLLIATNPFGRAQSSLQVNVLTPTSIPTDTLINTPIPTPTEVPTVAAAPDLGIGSTMVSDKDGMVLQYVPEGEFLMGSVASDVEAKDDEKPQHTIQLDAYWIDKTEVTNAQYRKCVEARGCEQPGGSAYNDGGKANHPVVNVSWKEANAYCAWAKRRLPTEAEWEKGARGTDGRRYPWGNGDPNATLANFAMNVKGTRPVGSYEAGASPYGALDMAGNVWEWVQDWYHSEYYRNAPRSNPQGPERGDWRVLRGGSWYLGSSRVRAANRDFFYSGFPFGFPLGDGGFRCARSL